MSRKKLLSSWCVLQVLLLACILMQRSSFAQRVGSSGTLLSQTTRLPIAVDWTLPYVVSRCFWLNDTRCVIMYDAPQMGSSQAALEVDVKNGIQRELHSLNRTFSRIPNLRVLGMSPDARWFLCKTDVPSATAVRRDGKVLWTWELPFSLESATILPDGKGWGEVNSFTGTDKVRIARFGEASERLLSLVQIVGTNAIGFTAGGNLLTYDISPPISKSVTLFEMPLKPRATPHQWSVSFPEPVNVREVVLSQDKQWLGWLVLCSGEKQRILLFRSLHSPELWLSGERTEIWVSRLDGSGLSCLATEEPLIEVDEKVTEYPYGLRWLPGGKQMSFFYRRALCLIPAVPERKGDVQGTSSVHNASSK